MIFLITRTYPKIVNDDLIDTEPDGFTWSLHRKEKGELSEPICAAVESWPTEKQCRAAINAAKRAMQGVRFAQTWVKEDDDG